MNYIGIIWPADNRSNEYNWKPSSRSKTAIQNGHHCQFSLKFTKCLESKSLFSCSLWSYTNIDDVIEQIRHKNQKSLWAPHQLHHDCWIVRIHSKYYKRKREDNCVKLLFYSAQSTKREQLEIKTQGNLSCICEKPGRLRYECSKYLCIENQLSPSRMIM